MKDDWIKASATIRQNSGAMVMRIGPESDRVFQISFWHGLHCFAYRCTIDKSVLDLHGWDEVEQRVKALVDRHFLNAIAYREWHPEPQEGMAFRPC